MSRKPRIDATVENHGTIFTFHLHTKAAKAWWREHVEHGPHLGCLPVVEHRYARDIAEGMLDAGLIIR